MIIEVETTLTEQENLKEAEFFAAVANDKEAEIVSSATFAAEANRRLTQLPAVPGDPEDLAYAQGMGSDFVELFTELLDVAAEVHQQETDQSNRFLKRLKTERLMLDGLDFITFIADAKSAGIRGDLLDIVTQLADAAYFVGKWGEVAPAKIKARIRRDRSENGRIGGLESGRTRQGLAAIWNVWVTEQAKQMRLKDPTIRPAAIVNEIDKAEWPERLLEKPAWDTMLDYIRELEKTGGLPKKVRLPKKPKKRKIK